MMFLFRSNISECAIKMCRLEKMKSKFYVKAKQSRCYASKLPLHKTK